MEIAEDILLQVSEQTRIKEKRFVMIPDKKGEATASVEIEGFLEFFSFKKDIESSIPSVLVSSDKISKPILEFTLEESGIYPVRFLACDQKGNFLHIQNYQHVKLPLKDNLTINIESGTPASKIEVLIRYV